MIAPLYDEVELCAPVFDLPVPTGDAALVIPNLHLCAVPPYYKKWEMVAMLHPIKLTRALWPHITKADSILINIPNYLGIIAWFICLITRKKFAIRIAGNWPEMMRLAFHHHNMIIIGNVVAFLHKILLSAIVKTSAVAFAHGKELADIYGQKNAHVVRIISSTIHESDIATSIAGSNSDNCKILYVGRLQWAKGLRELFRAAQSLQAERLQFHLIMAGDGSRRAEIEQEAEKLGLRGRIDFIGWVEIEKLKPIYSSSDIFVFPSYTETGPKVVIEAMANGLPVVVTKVGSVPLVMDNGKTGIVVPIKDADALRDALRRLIEDRPLRLKMAANSLERSHLFTMENERAIVRKGLEQFGLLESTGKTEAIVS